MTAKKTCRRLLSGLIIAGLLGCSVVGCTTNNKKSATADKENITPKKETYFTKLGFSYPEDKDAQIPAFLNADGFGKYATGGRGGRIVEVTNLNDSGEGSLRAALAESGPRTIIFRVSGTIELESGLKVSEGDVTIAGQTAPGDGICLKNYGMTIEADNVIVRYLRSRPGDTGTKESDCLWINKSNQVIADHLSTSWGTDETLSVSASDNVTVQNCLISESLNKSINQKGTHGMGSLIRGSAGQKVSFLSNLYFSHRSRNPMCGNYSPKTEDSVGFFVEFINNVVYNWNSQSAGKNHDVDSVTRYNFINNYYLPGPISTGTYMFSEGCPYTQMYASGNAMDGTVPEDQWSLFVIEEDNPNFNWDSYKLSERSESLTENIIPATETFEKVMEDVGDSLKRDEIDTAVIQAIRDKKGKLIDKPSESVGWSGQYPVLESTEPYTDNDKDGMDDSWETSVGLNPEDPSDGAAITECGYSNLEIFLEYLLQK